MTGWMAVRVRWTWDTRRRKLTIPLPGFYSTKEIAFRRLSAPAITARNPSPAARHVQLEPDGLTVSGHPIRP